MIAASDAARVAAAATAKELRAARKAAAAAAEVGLSRVRVRGVGLAKLANFANF